MDIVSEQIFDIKQGNSKRYSRHVIDKTAEFMKGSQNSTTARSSSVATTSAAIRSSSLVNRISLDTVQVSMASTRTVCSHRQRLASAAGMGQVQERLR